MAIYSFQIYLLGQEIRVRSFLAANHYVDFEMMSRLQIAQPAAYLHVLMDQFGSKLKIFHYLKTFNFFTTKSLYLFQITTHALEYIVDRRRNLPILSCFTCPRVHFPKHSLRPFCLPLKKLIVGFMLAYVSDSGMTSFYYFYLVSFQNVFSSGFVYF